MGTDDDADVFDLYDLIQTARTLNPARAQRQRALGRSVRALPTRELLEDARLLLKLASIRAQAEAKPTAPPMARRPSRPYRRRPGRPRTADRARAEPLAEIAALNQIRREREWSYRVLSEAVQRVGGWVSMDTLRAVILGKRRPHPKTLRIIQKFLRLQAKLESPPPPEPPAEPDASGEATH